MKTIAVVVSFVMGAVLATSSLARQVNLPSGNPIVGVDIPNNLKTSATSRGIEVRTADEEVFFWIEIYVPADYDKLVAEHEKYFKNQGVVITGTPKVSVSDEPNAKVQATDFPATWNGKPTVLRYLAIDPKLSGQNQILVSYWASPEGDRTHAPAFRKVLDSFGAPK
ncbi:MAG: hypothetical protein JWR08_750 [Enterovirga sp.]|jgi:hypothetical protein|nr:hypothetical protein [Enterovirga sp.]